MGDGRPGRDMEITELLGMAVDAGASDLHLKAGNYPMLRVHGALRPAVEDRRLDPDTLYALAGTLVPAALQARFMAEHEVDFATACPGSVVFDATSSSSAVPLPWCFGSFRWTSIRSRSSASRRC